VDVEVDVWMCNEGVVADGKGSGMKNERGDVFMDLKVKKSAVLE
jgi:hypothetical protein